MSIQKLKPRAFIEMFETRLMMSAGILLPDAGSPLLPIFPSTHTLIITQQPTTANVGQPLANITVEVFDSTGNLISGDETNITMSGQGLVGTTTVATQNGVAIFSDLTINTAGNEILTATDENLDSVSSQLISVSNNVTAGQRFAPITIDPSTLFSHSANNPKWVKVKLVNVVNGKTAITKTIYPKQGGPVVVKNLSSFSAGDFNVTACDSLGRSALVEQVTVVPAAAHGLLFIQQPRVLDINATVTVEVLDQYGNVTTQADGSQLSLHSWLPKGTTGLAPVLNGNTAAIVSDGIATFTGLSMDRIGQAHLIARLGSLKPTVSNIFHAGATLDITPGNNGLI